MTKRWFLVWSIAGCTPSDTPPSAPDFGDEECYPAEISTPQGQFFTDISERSGIQAGNFDPDPQEGTVINDHSRLAFADINGDGFDDIVMHSLYPNATNGVPFEHLVFLNNQDGSFTDHTDASGLRNVQAAFFAFADVDNDGDQDLYAGLDVPNLGSHRSAIYANDGHGRFTEVDDSGVDVASPTAATAAFADFDADGAVDLFVGNGHTSYAMTDHLFWGNGDGTFTQDTDALASPPAQPTNGTVTCDFDDDGDMDIFVGSYGVSVRNGHNQLWRNDGGHFTDVAVESGVAALAAGNPWSAASDYGDAIEPDADVTRWIGTNAFGVDCGDINNDGHLDLLVAAISHPSASNHSRIWSDPTAVFVNQGDGTFLVPSTNSGIPFNEGDIDAGLIDFDNDGRLDLSLTRDPKYEANYETADQYAWFGLLWASEQGEFESVGLFSGINVDIETGTDAGKKRQMKGGQNHAWADIDHDGDQDLLIGGRDQGGGRPNFLYTNDLGQDNRWIALSLRGDGESVATDAFGAQVRYEWSDEVILREKHGSRGTYNSEDSRWIHIGLGDRDCSATITVRWPNGDVTSLDWSQIGVNRFITIQYPDEIGG